MGKKTRPSSGGSKSPGGVSSGGAKKPGHSMSTEGRGKGSQSQRSAATVRRLLMYKQKPTRDKKGKLIKQDLQSKELPSTRIVPDRRWFGNTRVIGQKQLEEFREDMATKSKDGYTVIVKQKKLPLSLLADPERGRARRVNLLGQSPFSETFSAGRRQKRPKLASDSLASMALAASASNEAYREGVEAGVVNDKDLVRVSDGVSDAARGSLFEKGQSKRIWGELYKVVDSSDVIVQVLDARDPTGTRCSHLEHHLRKDAMKRHKHVILLLNKVDLVPAWVTKRWLHHLSREYPTLAFHASVTNPFGKGALLSLLRQFSRLRSDKQNVSVGFIGYPNVGKSSVINALKNEEGVRHRAHPGRDQGVAVRQPHEAHLPHRLPRGGVSRHGRLGHGRGAQGGGEDLAPGGRVGTHPGRRRQGQARVPQEGVQGAELGEPRGFPAAGGEAHGKAAQRRRAGSQHRSQDGAVRLAARAHPILRAAAQARRERKGLLGAIAHDLPQDAADAERRAADAFVEKANEAVARQVGRRMPAAHGMFDEEDQRGEEEDEEEEEEDAEEGDGDEESEGEGDEESDDALGSEDEDDALGSEEEEEEAAAALDRGGGARSEEDPGSASNPAAKESDEESDESDDDAGDDDGLDASALAKFASDDEEDEGGGGGARSDDGDESDGYGDDGLSWDAVLADVRGEAKAPEADENAAAARRARGGGGGSTFLRDAAKARKGGRKQKQPRGTVSFMPKEGKGAGGAQKRDRSKGAARTRLAERKAKRRVEV
jgi:nuclear GTP-binding protein